MNRASHIAIIMDGNGRWAKQRGEKRTYGHKVGAKVVREITEFCAKDEDIKRLTLYAFSTENWKRPRLEVEYLMKLLKNYLEDELDTYLKNNIRFEPIGDIRAFSNELIKTIEMLKQKTSSCNGLVQSIALNYGSRDEIIRAINSFETTDITEQMLSNALDSKEDVDILIRTGGDKRLSNFLLWQSSYAELFFSDKLWPDFNSKDLEAILKEYKKIERRFGGVKE
ncbi:MAG: polyprenyl diphosphate synthase [Sulfurimonadaceae bacterium]|jgi:undecaprenyl diphosphate synthase|nr:polyprenyl diphosphate synthase [Sulfurimonadaceae bacterium]